MRLTLHRGRLSPLALALVAALGCGGGDPSPQEQIRAWVRSAQTAANEQDTAALRALVAESYADGRGLTKADIDGMIGLQMLRGRPYVLLRVQDLALDEAEDGAQVQVLAGMARVPAGGFEEMLRVSADLYVFDLELSRAGQDRWSVTSARWRLARAEDLSP
jgi:hypothetical protein